MGIQQPRGRLGFVEKHLASREIVKHLAVFSPVGEGGAGVNNVVYYV